MDSHADSRQALRQYLLGSLPQDDLPGLEGRLLTDDGFYGELLLEEEELFDDYVARQLSADERARFEQHFLSTEARRRQLSFAQALGRYVSANVVEEPESLKVDEPAADPREPATPRGPTLAERVSAFWRGQSWGLRAALALGVVVLFVGAVWLLAKPGGPRTFATLTLSAVAGDRAEGVAAEKVRLPLAADALRVGLTLPQGTQTAARYRVELLSRGAPPESIEAEGQDGRTVFVVIPARRLAPGQYVLRLYAVAPDGTERRISGSYLFDAAVNPT